MGMTLLRMRFAALAVLAWGSACGGNVVVDGMPGEGSGGAGVTSSSASGTSNVGVTSTGGGGGDVRSKCLAYCEMFLPVCGAAPGSCGDVCDDQLSAAPPCNDRLAPFFDCAIEAFDCSVTPSRCQLLLAQYETCAFDADSGCGGLECFGGGDRACSCKGSCPGWDFAVECRPSGRSDISCSCLVNGSEVGTCTQAGSGCALAVDCCEPKFEPFR
ncbi:hypothetical protein WMF26_32170 [Sorangium sp. So ce185]|uniref:hypothetical protein n=1 Tax=Sorangium sp. So ce185 TaxID=3133287 RepID=UPI003F5D8FE8